jgi:homoserine O-acetyltransferase
MNEFLHTAPFELESGAVLPEVRLAYHTWGTLSPARDNVVWVLHALTGNSDVTAWWADMIGPGRVIDPERHFVVCANMLGSCYGSTGPTHVDPTTGQPWFASFPLVTNRDIVHAFRLLRDHLGIRKISMLIGGSLGGQQALEWAAQEHERIERIVVIAANARHSPWGIAFNAAQRMALESDPTFHEPRLDAGARGMAAARAVAMLSYRTRAQYNARQRQEDDLLHGFSADTYQRHQGRKLVERFSAHAYHALTRTMDAHDVGRRRGGTGAALRRITSETVVIGITSDTLFPLEEQQFIADQIPFAQYRTITCGVGHDSFLIRQRALEHIINTTEILHE